LNLPDYFADIVTELEQKSQAIRRDFATHRPSAGQNREAIIADLLRQYLPKACGIDTGLITSYNGQFSNQADLLIVDQTWNSPFYPTSPNRIWLVESIYAPVEVKTSLAPSDIADCVSKCRRFKMLPRNFSEAPMPPGIRDSLFIIWSYECPSAEVLKSNLSDALVEVPVSEQPDFVVVPSRLVGTAGSYRELASIGQLGSSHRQALIKQYGPNLAGFLREAVEIDEVGENALFVWLLWMLSWLKRVGPRNSELMSYLPQDKQWGRRV
jgi:hypothetical protein